jgi:CBS domain containing-hemolysin-like protein
LGEPTVEGLLHPLLGHVNLPESVTTSISFILAFAITTFLHVVVGELAPKSLAIQKTEKITMLLSRPIIIFYKVMYPFIWLLNTSANLFIRMFGLRPASEKEEAASEEELQIIIRESYRKGMINQSEYGYVNRIFAFDELVAREIMVPRIDMVCLDITDTREDILRKIREEQFTRFPVVSGSKDNVIGMINAKEYLLRYAEEENLSLQSLLKPVLQVAETTPVNNLLKKMQQKRMHIAVLIDEYGGTSGMVTIEDILEEIVGDIKDEFDADETDDILQIDERTYLVDGKVSLNRINEWLNVVIEHEDVDTIGGWLYSQNPELKKNTELTAHGLTFKIVEKDRLRIRRIQITRSDDGGLNREDQAPPASAAGSQAIEA